MLVIQTGLGVAALLFVVPLALAPAHQTGALIVFTLAVIMARMMHPAGQADEIRASTPALDAA